MDKILILLKKETITLYDIDGGKAAVHTISGEEVTDAEDYELVAEALRENYNDDELENLSVDVVYSVCDTEMIKSFTEELLPCGGWQVFEFKKILPEILLKNGMLKPDTTAEIAYDGGAYKVTMSKDGTVKISAAKKGKALSDNAITAIYKEKYNVFTDEEKLEQYNKQLSAYEKENKSLTQGNSKLSEENKKLTKENNKLSKENKSLTELNEHLKAEMKINENSREALFALLRHPVKGSSSGKVEWRIEDGEVVKKGQIIADNVSGSWSCKAGANGKLWHIKEDREDMRSGEVIGVIAHKMDLKKNAVKWAKKCNVADKSTAQNRNDTKINESIFSIIRKVHGV